MELFTTGDGAHLLGKALCQLSLLAVLGEQCICYEEHQFAGKYSSEEKLRGNQRALQATSQ